MSVKKMQAPSLQNGLLVMWFHCRGGPAGEEDSRLGVIMQFTTAVKRPDTSLPSVMSRITCAG